MKILVAVFAIDRTIHTETAKMLLVMGADKRADLEFMFVQHHPVDSARNQVIKDFLDGDYDFLISVDDDNGCVRNPIDLCFMGKDIIFCPTPIPKEGKMKLNVAYLTNGKGLQEIAKAGTGCYILSRKAAKTIPKPLFKIEYDQDGVCSMGEDIYFSENAAKYFKLYTHNSYPCHHLKTTDLLDALF